MFGLPDGTTACLFDMDGVVTQTALVHAAAWKDMFDKFLRQRAEQSGEKFVPFDATKDYGDYVDGKPRLDGTRSFLESRGIDLPEGNPDDKPGTPTIQGLSNEKNDLVVEKIRTDGVKVYDDTIRYIKAVRAGGLHTAPRGPSSPAPTPWTCSTRPGSRTCSMPGSTARWPRSKTSRASRPRTRF